MRRARAIVLLIGIAAMASACGSLLGIGDLPAENEPVVVDAAQDGTIDSALDSEGPVDGAFGDADASRADTGTDAGCIVGTTRCSSGSSVEMCSDGGDWNDAGSCGDDTPQCLNGACLAPSKDGGLVTPPSCLPSGPGMSNCGAGGSGIESCCASLEVEGGTFNRTYTNDPISGIDGGDPAFVSDFRLDKYEVTVGRFRQFQAAWQKGYVPPDGSGKHAHLHGGAGLEQEGIDGGTTFETGWVHLDDPDAGGFSPSDENLDCDTLSPNGPPWATWTTTPGDRESKPANCVTWAEAYAFCIWDGGFLPTLAEWRYANAGGSEQREFPWGETAPGSDNAYAIFGCLFTAPGSTQGTCVNVSNIAPVGTPSLGLGRWGQLDLFGNEGEWLFDDAANLPPSCSDCANLSSTSRWVGGAGFAIPARAAAPVDQFQRRSTFNGFRCARVP